MAAGRAFFTLDPLQFFTGLVFPYLFVVMMALCRRPRGLHPGL